MNYGHTDCKKFQPTYIYLSGSRLTTFKNTWEQTKTIWISAWDLADNTFTYEYYLTINQECCFNYQCANITCLNALYTVHVQALFLKPKWVASYITTLTRVWEDVNIEWQQSGRSLPRLLSKLKPSKHVFKTIIFVAAHVGLKKLWMKYEQYFTFIYGVSYDSTLIFCYQLKVFARHLRSALG